MADSLIQCTVVGNTFDQAEVVGRARLEALNALRRQGTLIKQLYEETTKTWKEHHPKFKRTETSLAGGKPSITVSTDDLIYFFLHEGTSKRWAVMSGDFRPKTEPRFIGSFPGQGQAILRGRKQMMKAGYTEAMPGIEARKWTDEIVKLVEPILITEVEEAFARGAEIEKAGGSVRFLGKVR